MPEFVAALSARTCVGCRSRAEKSQLLRVVVVEDACVPDGLARLPGRGAYLHREVRCLELADKRRAFPRAFRVAGLLDTTALARFFQQESGLQQDPGLEQDPGATATGQDTRAGR